MHEKKNNLKGEEKKDKKYWWSRRSSSRYVEIVNRRCSDEGNVTLAYEFWGSGSNDRNFPSAYNFTKARLTL